MKTLVFSDVHGQYDALMEALEASGYSKGDRLIVLGDMINYGSQSREVLEFLCVAKRSNPNCIFIRGNHENMLIYSYENNNIKSLYDWMESMTGATTLRSYGYNKIDASVDVKTFLHKVFPEEHLNLLLNTVESHEEGEYRFVHIPEHKGSLIMVHGHEHEHQPIVGFLRISIGITYGVAVLDIDKMVIRDNEGREFPVSQKRLRRYPHI